MILAFDDRQQKSDFQAVYNYVMAKAICWFERVERINVEDESQIIPHPRQ